MKKTATTDSDSTTATAPRIKERDLAEALRLVARRRVLIDTRTSLVTSEHGRVEVHDGAGGTWDFLASRWSEAMRQEVQAGLEADLREVEQQLVALGIEPDQIAE
jgi:hypothetical protein